MPVMGGLELLRRLRANGQHDLPVILLTACSDQRAAATEAGADAFLVKPIPPRGLLKAAERLLSKKGVRRAWGNARPTRPAI